MRRASRNWPPGSACRSNRVTSCPNRAARSAAVRPAGPAPTTAIRRRRPRATGTGAAYSGSVSRPARGFIRHETLAPVNTWSRQAWLQAMHGVRVRARGSLIAAIHSGSASRGRASPTSAAAPDVSASSASAGVVSRLEAITGMSTAAVRSAEAARNAARGTEVTMVGTRDSCHPMPVIRTSAPAASKARAVSAISARVCPSGTRSAAEVRTESTPRSPSASRTAATTAAGNRRRRSASPPYSSARRFVAGARNWLRR